MNISLPRADRADPALSHLHPGISLSLPGSRDASGVRLDLVNWRKLFLTICADIGLVRRQKARFFDGCVCGVHLGAQAARHIARDRPPHSDNAGSLSD